MPVHSIALELKPKDTKGEIQGISMHALLWHPQVSVSCSFTLRAVGTGIPYSGILGDRITEVALLSQRKEKSSLFGLGFAIILSSASHGFHVINHFQDSVHGWRRRFCPILEYMRISGFAHRGGDSLHSYLTRLYIYNCSCGYYHTGTTCRK